MKKFFKYLLGILILGGIIFAIGPRETIDESITFKSDAIGSDIDAYLTKAEEGIANLKPGAQKQMVWLDPANKSRQPFTIVYLHGFSATLEEIRPVPEMLARSIGANVFYARLKGHGRDGKAMAEASVNDWYNDVAEALAIGRASGNKIIILATSTGGTLATWAATQPELMKDVAAMVLVSPNYAVQAFGAEILAMPWARQILPMAFGEFREWEPKNDQQRQWWTTRYPNVALLPMQASVNRAADISFEELAVPALFIFHPDDGVVKSDTTRQIAGRWGKNHGVKTEVFEVQDSDDTMNHVIAGDILSPENNGLVADKSIAWLKSL